MPDAALEEGFATFARWQRKRMEHRPGEANDAFLAATWATGSERWKAAWADVEDWHPAIREQCAVLDAASEAMEKLTAERDGLRELIASILQSMPDTADEQEWRDRAGALGVTSPDGEPYRAWTEDDL